MNDCERPSAPEADTETGVTADEPETEATSAVEAPLVPKSNVSTTA